MSVAQTETASESTLRRKFWVCPFLDSGQGGSLEDCNDHLNVLCLPHSQARRAGQTAVPPPEVHSTSK